MLLIMLVAADRARVDRFADLRMARSSDNPDILIKLKAGILPGQADKIEQPADLQLRIPNKRLVFDIQDVHETP